MPGIPRFAALALGSLFISTGALISPMAQATAAEPLILAAAPTQITEAEVNALLQQMLAAAKAKDAKKLVSHFTPDATIEMLLPPTMGGKQSLKLGQYEKMLNEGWAMLRNANYTYSVENIQIKLYPDKDKALVSDETHEKFTFNGQKVHSVARENMLVVRHQGQLKIKVLKAKVELQP